MTKDGSNNLVTGTASSYDVMGQVLKYWQCPYYNCQTSLQPYEMDYGYDLAGDVASWTFPSMTPPGFTITNFYNSGELRVRQPEPSGDGGGGGIERVQSDVWLRSLREYDLPVERFDQRPVSAVQLQHGEPDCRLQLRRGGEPAGERNGSGDAEERMSSMTNNGGGATTTVTHNALEEQTQKVFSGYQLQYLYDPFGHHVGLTVPHKARGGTRSSAWGTGC